MPLPLPKLDNYTFDELAGEGQALIPRYAPEWTDHNIHDPGITLIEFFAWLSEMESYRLDRVTEASTRAFLRLLGIEPRPAQVAEAVLVVARENLWPSMSVPARTKMTTANSAVKFQTTHRVWLSPAKLVAVLAGPESALVDYTDENTASKPFFPFGPDPQTGDALYLGFDRRLAYSPGVIDLFVWTDEPKQDRQTKRALVIESKMERKEAKECKRYAWSCDSESDRQTKRAPKIARAKDKNHPHGLLTSWRLHYSVRTVWEYYGDGSQWLPLTEVTDRTRGLTLSGAIRFKAPETAKHTPGGVAASVHSSHYFIRCRIVSGGYDCPPQIQFVQINTVRAHHAVDSGTPQQHGISNGRAAQTVALPAKPIVPESTKLEVRLGTKSEQDWQEHLSWDRVGPYDHGYVLDPEHGQVRFGNGRAGAVPKAGAEIFITYQIGSGLTGNVPAGTRWTSELAASLTISQPFAAFGGAAAEPLFDAKSRAVKWLTEPHRAVTLQDFEKLALETPGVPIARAKALADYDPKLPCVSAPGSVTVVIISKCPLAYPVPGSDLLRAVEQYLERRRLLATEVHVIGPEYTKVAVHATLHVTPDTSSREVNAQASASLKQFFDPINGGQDGTGWPMGRAVYRSEILARLNALRGVIYVDEVTLETVLETSKAECDCCHVQEKTIPAQCGNIKICPHGLVISWQHQIKVLIERAV